jgi:hypothetical protein
MIIFDGKFELCSHYLEQQPFQNHIIN